MTKAYYFSSFVIHQVHLLSINATFRIMFTGIIQDVGTIQNIQTETDQTHCTFHTKLNTSSWNLGDSVAVDGCCLTITHLTSQAFSATLSLETLDLTYFSSSFLGQQVNLEPALCMGDPLGGHLVTGHIDGLVKVDYIHNVGEHQEMTFSVPDHLGQYIVIKGSIAINGVSLTVNQVQGVTFMVNIIPHTLAHTNLGNLKEGDIVNIETDMMGRYVERILNYKCD